MVDCIAAKSGEGWMAINGDSAEVLPQLKSESVDFSVYSVPFGDLFTYSDSERDLGNCATDEEFFEQYGYIIREKLRLTKPGRLTAVHCSNLPTRKWRDGYIGTHRFAHKLCDAHEDNGWQFARDIIIRKDPVVENTRSHAVNLGHGILLADSTRSWPGSHDYVMLFRKPGKNVVPVAHSKKDFPVEQWQEWAESVWMNINQTDTLNNKAAASKWIGGAVSLNVVRSEDDERHVCPLQLHLIERLVIMYCNPGEIVMSPFAGIGSEGVVSVRRKRKFLGVELNGKYWESMCGSLESAHAQSNSLFDMMNAAE
jgi:DNA modification methylase